MQTYKSELPRSQSNDSAAKGGIHMTALLLVVLCLLAYSLIKGIVNIQISLLNILFQILKIFAIIFVVLIIFKC